MFFDVTELLAANAELKDALQVQELLNDSILAGTKNLQRTQGAAIRSLARLAEYRDPETGFHLQRICEYTRLLALAGSSSVSPYSFRITREYADDISLSSMLHDIGKVSIPDSILLKPGKLDPEEWEMMKKHTRLRVGGAAQGGPGARRAVLSHPRRHHRPLPPRALRRQGVPERDSAGDEIRCPRRISAVADVYDALTTIRPYKEAWSHERAARGDPQPGGDAVRSRARGDLPRPERRVRRGAAAVPRVSA